MIETKKKYKIHTQKLMMVSKTFSIDQKYIAFFDF